MSDKDLILRFFIDDNIKLDFSVDVRGIVSSYVSVRNRTKVLNKFNRP